MRGKDGGTGIAEQAMYIGGKAWGCLSSRSKPCQQATNRYLKVQWYST